MAERLLEVKGLKTHFFTDEGVGTLRDTRTLNRLLLRKGYKPDALRYQEYQGHQHREADWAWRLPQALEFLLLER